MNAQITGQSHTGVLKLYHSVIEDVIAGVRDSFLDEGVDEQVLQELKQIWETKLISSKAVELNSEPHEPQAPQKETRNNLPGKAVINQVPHFTTGQHGSQGLGSQQTQMVQQIIQQPTTQAQTLQSQSMHQQNTQQLTQHSQNIQQSQPGQQQPSSQTTNVITTDPNKQIPIHITLPPHSSSEAQPRVLTIQVPASALQGNQLHAVLAGPIISATMALPQHLACSLLQQHVTAALQGQAASGTGQMIQQVTTAGTTAGTATSNGNVMANRQGFQQTPGTIRQLDGHQDTSDEEEDEDDEEDMDDDDDDDNDKDDENEDDHDGGPEEEPLNSEDDVSDEDPSDLFDTENVVVCQYDKITRCRNKWKFHLKDGIMNLSGKDYVFQKANGDAEW